MIKHVNFRISASSSRCVMVGGNCKRAQDTHLMGAGGRHARSPCRATSERQRRPWTANLPGRSDPSDRQRWSARDVGRRGGPICRRPKRNWGLGYSRGKDYQERNVRTCILMKDAGSSVPREGAPAGAQTAGSLRCASGRGLSARDRPTGCGLRLPARRAGSGDHPVQQPGATAGRLGGLSRLRVCLARAGGRAGRNARTWPAPASWRPYAPWLC